MSIPKGLLLIAAGITEIANSLYNANATLAPALDVKPAETKKTDKTDKKAKTVEQTVPLTKEELSATAKTPEKQPAAGAPVGTTVEQVYAECLAIVKAIFKDTSKGPNVLKPIFEKFGAQGLPTVPKDKLVEFLDALKTA